MGLDNIPKVYPCTKAGTAVMADDKIDCQATMAADQCPWKAALDASDRGTAVTGMFGVPCWYRGKAGTWMLEALVDAGYGDMPGGVEGFYGDSEELSVDHCRALSEWMAAHIEAYAKVVDGDKDSLDEYRYAAWWLGWIADAGDGSVAWW